jgi:ribosomal protein S18 acetylase RimI-like enzyme
MLIRRARKADCSRLYEIVVGLSERERDYIEALVDWEPYLPGTVVCEVDGVIAGFIMKYPVYKGEHYVHTIAVDPRYRRLGVGEALFNYYRKKHTLTVHANNENIKVIGMLKKNGCQCENRSMGKWSCPKIKR